MFLRNSIERILSDKDIRRKEHAELKKACESALEQLKAEIEHHNRQTTGGILPSHQEYISADGYFYPFELACHSKTPRIVVTALDCLQKLIAYGHLVGDGPDPADSNRLLIDRIITAICNPFTGPQTDDNVQLQIIKVLLVVVLSNTAKAHGASLLLAVRTCFNIYLASRNDVNRKTARGILTQTINSVFLAMKRKEQLEQNIELDLDELVIKNIVESLVNQVVATEQAFHVKESLSVVTDDRSTSMTNMNGTHSPLSSQPSTIATLSVEALADHLPSTIEDPGNTLEFRTQEEQDAFLIFRALCKLSMKDIPDGSDPKSHELRSKMLSLEMILSIVQDFNTPLTDKHTFIYAIRHFLCVALTKNAVSPIIEVFEKALAIFVELVNKFKIYLKRQIEVFFKEIIISIVESSSSSYEHKWIVMNTISKICDNSQSVVDIYINYDCHLTSTNILQILCDNLSKIAGGFNMESLPNANLPVRERERKMCILALGCLVKVLKCLVTFHDEVNFTRNGELSMRGDEPDESSDANGSNSHLHIEQLKQKKAVIESGIELFAKKPGKGIAFMQENGFVGKAPDDIARFFHDEERLDKRTIGDYLGDGDEFNRQVMYCYIDRLEFTDLPFVQALRLFLSKFRLPGEAQKIDRLMEKFASRYLECNPTQTLFASADTAYVLSYAIIMLTTDLHNPQVRKKMTKNEFINTVKGINDQNDLPQDFVSDIYDDIAVNEIKMKPDGASKPKLNADVGTVSYRQLKEFQSLELESIYRTSHALMQAASSANVEFTTADNCDHVRLMFKLIWMRCLAAFSIGLKSSDDEEIWRLCLEGLRLGIRVACVFRLNTERNVYMQALTQFTLLTTTKSLSEMKARNVESIKLLITIGVEDGDFLDENWYDVLKCISQLELAQLIGTMQNGHSYNLKNVFHIDDRTIHAIQGYLDTANSQSVVVAVDRIFQGSARLSSDAIVHFVRELCRVSSDELSLPGTPRMYMLTKIVDVASSNINRIRIEWSRIWNILGEHFNVAGCSSNETVSHFALDALRQLSTKFLEKGELPNFRLQKEFLRPFEVIMSNTLSFDVREMTIACITNMVQTHSGRIRSGWKNVFIVFKIAASETREEIIKDAFTTTSHIVLEIFPKHFAEVIDSFPDAVSCLSEFACNNLFPDTCMEAIRLIRFLAELVRNNTELFNNESDGTNDATTTTTPASPVSLPSSHSSPLHTVPDNQRVWAKGWLSIFIQLWSIISRCKLDVRTRSLTVLFEIIKTYGRDFRPGWWTDVFTIIFKIFKFTNIEAERSEWMVTTCNHALFAIVDVFSEHFTLLIPHVPTFYDQLFLCVQQGSEQLARAAIDVLENLVVSNGQHFSPDLWDHTVELIEKIFECSMTEFSDPVTTPEDGDGSPQFPSHILPLPKGADADSVLVSTITRCTIQLEIVDAVTGILFGKNAFKVEGPPSTQRRQTEEASNLTWSDQAPKMFPFMSTKHLSTLIRHLQASHDMARTFNAEVNRAIRWKAVFQGKCPPNLTKQETHTIHCTLNILFHLYGNGNLEDAAVEQFRQMLTGTVNDAIEYYVSIRVEQTRSAWLPVVQMLLNRTFDLSDGRFRALGTPYLLRLNELVETNEPQIIRTALKRVLARALLTSTTPMC